MNIDSNKTNNQIPKDKNSLYTQVEKNSQFVLDNALNNSINVQTKDFASILKSTSGPKDTVENEKKTEKENVKNENEDVKTENKETKNVREETREKSDSEENSDHHREQSFGQIQTIIALDPKDITAPNARAILHIADLERIISSIRANQISDGKQITIELKRSIFQGLELKLTIGKDKSITAEFITSDKNVQSQLNAKAEELAGILRDRGVKLSKLEMTLNSDTNQREKQNSYQNQPISKTKTSLSLETSEIIEQNADSDTSYQI